MELTESHTLEIRKSTPLKGQAIIPGDKSISHRALILGALCEGETTIRGLLESADVLATAEIMRTLGVSVLQRFDGAWRVNSQGIGHLTEPKTALDCGNSGTSARLIMGLLASYPMAATFIGDSSLCARPMKRVIDPLSLVGAKFYGRSGGYLPLTMIGARHPKSIVYQGTLPSAQLKSAVLLAGLSTQGETVFTERVRTRDHTERMLSGFGAKIETLQDKDGAYVIHLEGLPRLRPQMIEVPSDPSSAAFVICAALITPGSSVLVPNVGMNSTRNGLFVTLQEMGADLVFENAHEEGGEPVADITARFSPEMKGVIVPPERAPSMIDEYPILSVVAAFAEGETAMRGVGELRVKESDRISTMAQALRACGIEVKESETSLTVKGCGIDKVPGGGMITTHLDHRIAMSLYCLGLGAKNPVTLDDTRPIATSFPHFIPLMQRLAGQL